MNMNEKSASPFRTLKDSNMQADCANIQVDLMRLNCYFACHER